MPTTTLARYVPAGRASPYVTAARTAYTYRRPIGQAAKYAGKRIWKAYKGYKSRKSKRARMAPGAPSVCKSVQDLTTTLQTNVTIETLYKDTLIAPSQPTSQNEYNVRDKAIVMYKGFKICRVFENSGNQWLRVHYAVIQWRKDTYESTTDDMKQGFFRDTSAATSNNTRTTDFEDVTGARLFNHKYDCLAMNPNKKYRIISHKAFTLHPRRVDTVGSGHVKRFDYYMKVNKRMNFARRDSTQPDSPFDEVWWYTTLTQTDWNAIGNPPNYDQLKTWNTNRLYFRG